MAEKKSLKKSIKRIIILSVIIFVGLFAFRFVNQLIEDKNVSESTVYSGYLNMAANNMADYDMIQNEESEQSISGLKQNIKRNYASKSYKRSGKVAKGTPAPVNYEQKYEKVASMSAKTEDFDGDEKKLREAIKNNNSIIQFERKSGLKPYRTMELSIGVDPTLFDKAIEEFSAIGNLLSISIDKVDKTSEFIDLNTQRKSLENLRNALIALQRQGGRLDEKIELVTKINEVEKQIQDLGAQLGDFSVENEFCTVRLTLSEAKAIKKSPKVWKVMRTSIRWTIKWFLLGLLTTLLILLGSFVIVKIIEKLDWLPDAVKTKLREE